MTEYDLTPNDQQIAAREAAGTKRNMLAAIQPGADEPIQRGDVYDYVERMRCFRFLVGGDGPTTTATVMIDAEREVTILIESTLHTGAEAHEVITGPNARPIAEALVTAAREDGMTTQQVYAEVLR